MSSAKATESLGSERCQALAATYRAALKGEVAVVKQLKARLEAMQEGMRRRYARRADVKLRLEITRLQKEKEDEVNAMRERYESRVPERARREEDQIQKDSARPRKRSGGAQGEDGGSGVAARR